MKEKVLNIFTIRMKHSIEMTFNTLADFHYSTLPFLHLKYSI